MNLPDPLFIFVMLSAIGIAPFAAVMVTSFTKIIVVLGLLRQALGVQQVPPNMVLNGIAIILTIYVMAPVGMQIADNLKGKLQNQQFGKRFEDISSIADAVANPLRGFLEAHTSERDKKFFMQSAQKLWPADKAKDLKESDMLVLIPGFTVSELTEAFKIGFQLYLAFVVVDLVVANILLALQMSMISPTVISVPFKLLLFVALDGWARLVQNLVLTYA
jgi:type III secretion protein R